MMTRMTNESKQKSDADHMSQEVIEIFTFSMMQGRICVLGKSRPLFKPPLSSYRRTLIQNSLVFSNTNYLAYENIRFSLLFAAGDVQRGGTSATQRQKFHTEDVKSVQNPVRSADWSTE